MNKNKRPYELFQYEVLLITHKLFYKFSLNYNLQLTKTFLLETFLLELPLV